MKISLQKTVLSRPTTAPCHVLWRALRVEGSRLGNLPRSRKYQKQKPNCVVVIESFCKSD